MILTMLKSKIHRATVTACDISYEGSITIDPALIDAAGMLPYEQVDVLNIINGAAARLVQPGDLVIVCTYASMSETEAGKHEPTVVVVDAKNKKK
jgi:aspartate 1-decarboxylase